jgi:hypothetical protein
MNRLGPSVLPIGRATRRLSCAPLGPLFATQVSFVLRISHGPFKAAATCRRSVVSSGHLQADLRYGDETERS